MAALMRRISQLKRTSLVATVRTLRSAGNLEMFEDIPKDDQPIKLENPFEKEKEKCVLCRLGIDPDYKNVRLLSQFQSTFTGRIYGKHITGLCAERQAQVENEIIKAQNAGLMAYYVKDSKYAKDPKLFDPNNPFRTHKY